jgi:ribosomal protein S17E
MVLTIPQAHTIVRQYDSYVRERGESYAEEKYLRKGTPAYETNKRLLEEARRIVSKRRSGRGRSSRG